MKGFGFTFAAGKVTAAVASVPLAASLAAGVAAAGIVYFIPWEYLFEVLKKFMGSLWDRICVFAKMVLEKLRQIASSAVSFVMNRDPLRARGTPGSRPMRA